MAADLRADSRDWADVRMVTTPGELEGALREWSDEPVLGLDTESNSFYAYFDRLCLLQVSTPHTDYIVDPLALGESLRAVNDLLVDESIIKVFHSAEFDLMLIKKDLGTEIRGLFDTQVAMTLLQHDKTGLAALLESTYGIKLSKKEQRSDWGRRPLRPEQIEYARVDTHFLPDLHARLHSELTETNMLRAAEGEFRRLEIEVLAPREPDMEGWRRIKGARKLEPEAAARFRELFVWRELSGQKADLPVFRVLSNETLIDLAAAPPTDMPDLARRSGVGWRKARKVGEGILKALAEANGKRIERVGPKPATPADSRKRRVRQENQDVLRRWRKKMADELGLPSERLIHRRHLEEIGRKIPRDSTELLQLVPLNDWQREHLEMSLLEVLAELPDPEQA